MSVKRARFYIRFAIQILADQDFLVKRHLDKALIELSKKAMKGKSK